MSPVLYLSFRNFFRHNSRYIIILYSLITVTVVFVIQFAVMSGLRQSVLSKTSRYFAGDVVIQAYRFTNGNGARILMPDLSELYQSTEADKRIETWAQRTLYLSTPRIFFNGSSVKQRRIIGAEWGSEAHVLREMSFVDGTVPEEDDRNGILISTAVSELLGARTGDQVLLKGARGNNQQNTRLFIVRGIFDEGSFFGYASYVPRQALNEFLGYSDHVANEVGVFLNRPHSKGARETFAQDIREKLEAETAYTVFPVLNSQTERDQYLRGKTDKDGIFLAVLTVDAQASEITELLRALIIIAVSIISIFGILIAIGVSNAFSTIVYERRTEIGMLRALGMLPGRVVGLFLGEIIFLVIIGCTIGIVLGIMILYIAGSLIDVSHSAFMSLFLQNGKIPWHISVGAVLGIFALSFGACLFGGLQAVYKTSTISPVEALRQE